VANDHSSAWEIYYRSRPPAAAARHHGVGRCNVADPQCSRHLALERPDGVISIRSGGTAIAAWRDRHLAPAPAAPPCQHDGKPRQRSRQRYAHRAFPGIERTTVPHSWRRRQHRIMNASPEPFARATQCPTVPCRRWPGRRHGALAGGHGRYWAARGIARPAAKFRALCGD